MKFIWIRIALYIPVTLGITELLMFETAYSGREKMFSEFGLVQLAQSLFLLAAVVIMWFASRSGANYQHLAVCFMLFFAMLLIRENDQIFELWLIDGFWKWVVLAVLLVLGVYFVRHRRAILRQLGALLNTLPFLASAAAFLCLMFAHLL